MYQKKAYNRTGIFVFLLLMFLLQDPMQFILPPLKVLDELFALMIVPFFLLKLRENDFEYTFTRKQVTVILLLLCFWITGWAGTLINHYQPMSAVLRDCYVVVKFFMAIGASYFLFQECDYKAMRTKLWPILNAITLFLFVVCILDLVFHIWPSDERNGLRTIKIFYSVYTILVANCCFLAAIYLRLYQEYRRKIEPWLLMLAVIMVLTGRFKAIGAIVVLFFLYMILCRQRRRPGFFAWSAAAAGAILISARQFFFYYGLLKDASARSLLTTRSIMIAKDYFPFGTGWATYGSAFSGDQYSPVYYLYHLDQVWGLTPQAHTFVSDTFWPMLLGECGWFGTVFYAAAIVILTISVYKLGERNAYASASGLLPLIYLFISSTSESAFVHTMAIPLGFWLGYLFAENEAEVKP